MGSDEDWELATDSLRAALDDLGLDYVVNEETEHSTDLRLISLRGFYRRTWQCGTIQLDFSSHYVLTFTTGADGEKHRQS